MFCAEKFCTLLLEPENYNPDTINLKLDEEASNYWFDCFQDLIKKFAIQAEISAANDLTAKKRAENFQNEYLENLKSLKNCQTNSVTIRDLLDLNEKLLREHGFVDPWLEQKRIENEKSISQLKSRLEEIDRMDYHTRWIELIQGLLAGNIFDWGAQVVADILNSDDAFGLSEALLKIQSRPWLIDNLDQWLERLKGPPHKCACIFVDNSGVDIVLGVLPFARELLKRQTKVLLCANTEPSLNDTTYRELEEILVECSVKCDIIKKARSNGNLFVYGNGQKGPCLDMRKLSKELCQAIETNETDLLVIEGMGRALHTNLNAKFCCETLKLAVIKNKWLANRLGGDIFSVICKYESNRLIT